MTCPEFFHERRMSLDPIHTLHKCGFPIKRKKKKFCERSCGFLYRHSYEYGYWGFYLFIYLFFNFNSMNFSVFEVLRKDLG